MATGTKHTLIFDSNSSARLDIRPVSGNCRYNSSSIGSVTRFFVSRGSIGQTNAWTTTLAANDTLKVSDTSDSEISSFTVSSVTQGSNSDNLFATINVTGPSGAIPSNGQTIRVFLLIPVTANAQASLDSAFTITSTLQKQIIKSADASITSTATVSSQSNRIRDAAVSMQAFDTVLYVGNKIISASVTINSITTISASGNKFINAQTDINSSATLSAVGRLAITHSGAIASSSTATLVSDTVRIRPGDVNVTSTAQLTALGVKSSDVSSSLSATASISARLGRVISASTSITAFNSVVSATLRIRPGVDLTDSQAVMTVSAGRIRPGRSVYIDPQAPTGIIVDSTHITSIPAFYNITGQSSAYITSGYTVAGYTYTGGDYNNANNVEGSGYGSLETFLPVKEISFWLNCAASNQVIWSTAIVSDYSGNGHRSLVFSRTGTGFKLVYKEWTGYDLTVPTVNNTLTWAQAIGSGWAHIFLSINYGNPSIATLYINGDNIGTGTGNGPGDTKLANPIILGAEQRITGDAGSSSRTYDYINTSSDFEIAQFWAGRMGSGISNPSLEIYNVTGAWTGSQGYRNLGASGKDGANERFETVYFYNELDYPYALGRTSPGDDRPTILNRFQLVGDSYITTDDSYKPGWLARTPTTFADEIIPYYPARFRLFALGGQVLGGELIASSSFELTATATDFTKANAVLTSAATITARLSYKKSAEISITASAAISATITGLVSSETNISANATLVVTAYEFTKATAAITGAFTLSADPDEISGGIALSLGSFSITASGATTKRASTALASAATLTANAADKNMGEAVLFTAFTISATPRVTFPIRPEAMTMSAAFTQTSTGKRFRDSQVPMASAWTFANGVTRAIKTGVVTMTAFDTVLSAGRLIEFLAENTIAVTEEQRRLRVALESTVLLVQMSNGVNTITAETTEVVVPQEQGRLLAQYNIPTN